MKRDRDLEPTKQQMHEDHRLTPHVSHPFRRSLAMFLAGLAVAWPVWEEMLKIGWRAPGNGHILLAPAVAAYLAWSRRDLLENVSYRSWLGTAILGVGMAALWVGDCSRLNALRHLDAIVTAVGAAATLLTPRNLRNLLPAFGALLFMIPVPSVATDWLSFPLMEATARIVAGILGAMGASAEACGSLIRLEGAELTVAEACGGLPLVWGMLVMSYAACAAMPVTALGWATTFAADPLLALAGNAIRLVIVAWLYDHAMVPLADSFHDVGGQVIVGTAWLIPYLLARVFTRRTSRTPSARLRSESSVQRTPHHRQSRRGPLPASLVLLSLVAAGRPGFTADRPEHHGQCPDAQSALDLVPYRVRDWVGMDVELPAPQLDVLKPDALLNRRFVHFESGTEFLLTVVFHRDAHDHAGHKTPGCYRAIGWHVEDSGQRTWMVCGRTIPGTVYSMTQRSKGQRHRLTVHEIVMAAPKGRAQSSQPSGNEDGPRFPTNAAARILVVFGDQIDPASRDAIVLRVLESLEPLAQRFRPAVASEVSIHGTPDAGDASNWDDLVAFRDTSSVIPRVKSDGTQVALRTE